MEIQEIHNSLINKWNEDRTSFVALTLDPKILLITRIIQYSIDINNGIMYFERHSQSIIY